MPDERSPFRCRVVLGQSARPGIALGCVDRIHHHRRWFVVRGECGRHPDSAIDAWSVGDGSHQTRVPFGAYALTLSETGEHGAAPGDSDLLAPTVLIADGAMRTIIGADEFGAAGDPR